MSHKIPRAIQTLIRMSQTSPTYYTSGIVITQTYHLINGDFKLSNERPKYVPTLTEKEMEELIKFYD